MKELSLDFYSKKEKNYGKHVDIENSISLLYHQAWWNADRFSKFCIRNMTSEKKILILNQNVHIFLLLRDATGFQAYN